VAELKAQLSAIKKRPGVNTLGNGTAVTVETIADPVAAWNEAVDSRVKAGVPKAKAIRQVVLANPELHQAYLEAAKADR
jgi:hypothetical protein